MTTDEVEVIVESLLTLLDQPVELKIRLTELVKENFRLKDLCNDDSIFEINSVPIEKREINCETYEEDSLCKVLSNEKTGKEPLTQSAFKVSCFNCGENHVLSHCEKPKDYRRISMKKREFSKTQSFSQNSRYHLDFNQKFGHIKPGLPSSKLRAALGINENQIPPYIYHMRECGYPPGWLQEAEIDHSGVSLYVSKDTIIPDVNDEEGEIVDLEDKKKYDTRKLQKWPGFNIPLNESLYLDETSLYNVPPMNPKNGYEAMISSLKHREQTGYVRGEMQNTNSQVNNNNNNGSQRSIPLNSVKSSSDGTPTPPTPISPYRSLPSLDKWNKGSTEHILFENLPNSSGHWERVTSAIRKKRKMN